MVGDIKLRKIDGEIQVTISSSSKPVPGLGIRAPLMDMQGSREQVTQLLRSIRDELEEQVTPEQALVNCFDAATNMKMRCSAFPALLKRANRAP